MYFMQGGDESSIVHGSTSLLDIPVEVKETINEIMRVITHPINL